MQCAGTDPSITRCHDILWSPRHEIEPDHTPTSYIHTRATALTTHSRFRSTRLPTAGSATTTFLFAFFPRKAAPAAFSFAALAAVDFVAAGAAAARLVRVFAAAVVAALIAVAVALVPRFVLMIVVPLDIAEASDVLVWLDVWLAVRWGEPITIGRAGGSILPGLLMAGLAGDVFSREAVRLNLPAAAAVPRLVDSIIPCIDAEMALVAAEAAVLKGEAGLRGEIGRVKALFRGDICLMGDCGRVREL